MIALDGASALAWRLRRQALRPAAATGVVDVAERVLAARGWPEENAELSFALRREHPRLGDLEDALGAGQVIRAYAFRGGSYVFTPETARTLLRVRTATRVWETRRYQDQGEFRVEDWAPLRTAVREVLGSGPATRAEIAAYLAASPSLGHLAEAAASGAGSDSLYKPLHWWGDICFGPSRDKQSTFRLLSAEPLPMVPDPHAAGRLAVAQYLRSYGPATVDNVLYWLADGLSAPRRAVLGWVSELGEAVTEVFVDGAAALVATETLDEIRGAPPAAGVVLVPGYDPWVMGPGTADTRLVPPARRADLSRGAGAVVASGRVSGTWRSRAGRIEVSWFAESGPVPQAELEDAAARLAAVRAAAHAFTVEVSE